MNPIDKLTELDKKRIERYVHAYAHGDKGSWCGVDHYLRFWNEAKADHLFKLFGEELRISIPIEYMRGEDELVDELDRAFNSDPECVDFINALRHIYGHYTQEYDIVARLINLWTLAKNKYESYRTFDSLTLKNGKELKFNNGTKPMRVIRKLAKSYEIPGFEHFMNIHSQCLNQKGLKGTIHMSIHPMDYMTMSDNDEGWESCMSWVNDGCYKQGTVEMMNSPCAVVGYLQSDSHDFIFDGYNSSRGETQEEGTWNSKKWRSLFLVDEDFIVNIKQYPYCNTNLVRECVQLLAKQAGWGDVRIRDFQAFQNNVYNDRQVSIRFTTGAMYNDFGNEHFLALAPHIEGDYYVSDYCYSGVPMCVWCGSTNDEVEIGESGNEGMLLCDNCGEYRRCDCCGEHLPSNEDFWYWVGDDCICESCYENSTTNCAITDNTCYTDDVISLYLNVGYDDDEKIHNNRYKMESIDIQYKVWDDYQGCWEQYFNIDEPRRAKHNAPWGPEYDYYVNIEDCTERGLIYLFDLNDQDEIKDYRSIKN